MVEEDFIGAALSRSVQVVHLYREAVSFKIAPVHMSDSALPSPEAVRAFYDRTYQAQGLADPAYLYRWIVQLLHPTPGRTILDVACGEGHLLSYAHQAQLVPSGIDISSEAITRATVRCPEATLSVGNGEALPFPDGAFDFVTSLGSLEHYRDMDAGLKEMARVLKPDGVACIMVPNVFWLGDVLEVLWRGGCSSSFQVIERHGTRQGWRHLLEAHGVVVQQTLRYNKPYPLFAGSSWKLKSLRKFLWRRLFNALCPFNLSLEFIYLCRKRHARSSRFEVESIRIRAPVESPGDH